MNVARRNSQFLDAMGTLQRQPSFHERWESYDISERRRILRGWFSEWYADHLINEPVDVIAGMIGEARREQRDYARDTRAAKLDQEDWDSEVGK